MLRPQRFWISLACCWVVCIVQAAPDHLDTIEVTATPNSASPFNSRQQLEEQLLTVPGGTNLVSLENIPNPTTLSDVLGNQPGLVVQEFFGGLDQPRLNIRGSGLQANPVSRGVLIRENNLPVNEADGSFIIGMLDLKNTAAITVHRGANSRVPGATTLGGDINFISHTQADTKNLFAVSSGSFSRQDVLLNHQRALPNSHYGLGFYDARADGYRNHSASTKRIIRANAGFGLSSQITNQSYLRHTQLHFDMPFVLAAERAESDPQSVYGDGDELFDIGLNMYARDPHRSVRQLRITNETRADIRTTSHRLGVYWQQTDDAFVDPISHIETQSTLRGLQYTLDHYPNAYFHYQIGFDINHSDIPRNYFGNHPLNGDRLANYASFALEAGNTSGSLLFDLTVFPEWILTGQLQYNQTTRKGTHHHHQTQLDETWKLWMPKLGIIYQPSLADMRLFSNISRSIEVPTFWEIIGTQLNPLLTNLSQAFFLDLEPQKATTVEVGGQFTIGRHSLDITAYRSKLTQELMSTASQYGVIANTLNYDDTTIHQGLELGIKGQTDYLQGTLLYQTTWNYSDFYFADGPFANNQIAGIPEHIVSGELLYRLSGMTHGPTLTLVPGNNPADHVNQLQHQGYQLIGWKFLWHPNPFLQAHLAINNLTDEAYNSTYVIRERSNPDLPTFLPGNGLNLSAGVRFQL